MFVQFITPPVRRPIFQCTLLTRCTHTYFLTHSNTPTQIREGERSPPPTDQPNLHAPGPSLC